jgi:hypothetical protein
MSFCDSADMAVEFSALILGAKWSLVLFDIAVNCKGSANGFGAVEAEIGWAKLSMLKEGIKLL